MYIYIYIYTYIIYLTIYIYIYIYMVRQIERQIDRQIDRCVNKQHNFKVLATKNVDRLCRNKDSCPLDGKCLQACIVYKAYVITNKDSHIYYGASYGEFISQYNNHTNSLRHCHHKQDTKLLQLQDKGINFILKWSISAYASTYRCGSRNCLTEKYVITRADQKNLLNKRTELPEVSLQE